MSDQQRLESDKANHELHRVDMPECPKHSITLRWTRGERYGWQETRVCWKCEAEDDVGHSIE